MDRTDRYRSIVIGVLEDYAKHVPSHGRIQNEVVIDRQRDHYLLMLDGWDGQRRIHGCVIHIDIRDGQVWLQRDGTSRPVADELVEAGISPEDIVLGFQPDYIRPHTPFPNPGTPVNRTAGATDPGPSVPARGR